MQKHYKKQTCQYQLAIHTVYYNMSKIKIAPISISGRF